MEHIKFSKIAHAILSKVDDGENVRNVTNSFFGMDSKELERFFDWCEENDFEVIVKLYYDELG
jgi:hypothetical protein